MLRSICYFVIAVLISASCVAVIRYYYKPAAPVRQISYQSTQNINNREQFSQEDEWNKRIRNLPQTFGTQYYNWIQNGQKIGYMVLSIKDAKYEGQEVFKVKGKWVVNKPVIGFAEITSYTKKNKYLTPLYEEVKGSAGIGFATFDMKLKVQDGKGKLTGETKAVGKITSLDKTVDIPENMITWEGGFICATVLPPDENLLYGYSIFALNEEDGLEPLKTAPLKFAGKEEIAYKNEKVECYKFAGKLRENNIYFWVDENHRLIKGLAGDSDEIVLTDKNDALTMSEDKTKQAEKKKDIKTGKPSWSGAHSKIKEEEFYLVKTKEEWAKMWQHHSPNDNIPEIDFTEEMCVGIFAGQRSNSWGIKVVSITEEIDKILFKYEHLWYQTMGEADNATPFGIFVLPYSDKKVILEENVQGYIGGSPLWKRKKVFGGSEADTQNPLPPSGWVWTKQFGTARNDKVSDIVVDILGSVYVCGDTEGSLNGYINPGDRSQAYAAKYDANGNQIWFRQFGTKEGDEAVGISIDTFGNLYVCGHTWGGIDGNVNAGDKDIFVIKFDGNGNRLWTTQIGSGEFDYAHSIALDSSNNIYVVGVTGGNLDGNSLKGGGDGFIVKYNSDGVKQWTKLLGAVNWTVSEDIAIDKSNNIYISGHTCSGFKEKATSDWHLENFLTKYNSNGERQWLKILDSHSGKESNTTVDSAGNIYVSVSDSLGKGSSDTYVDVFITKYTPAGELLWTKLLSTPGDDRVAGITADINNNIYVCGYTSDKIDDVINAGTYDFFMVKYDSNGKKLWSKQSGTNGHDWASSIAVDNKDNVYIGGYTTGGLNGNNHFGFYDAFVTKYKNTDSKK
ncbi:MAG: SBBP repeat-containing protein [Planctomycetota bacterium]